ncbi:MAG: tetratricopeptide repeat protein [Pirellulales bacterium]|nr:tetratricopeptide repeat protein [Pirellulales bacterium]
MNIERCCSLIVVSIISLLFGCGGCGDAKEASQRNRREEREISGRQREKLMTYAIDSLNRLDEFNTSSIVPQIFRRLEALAESDAEDSGGPSGALLAAWPETEMLAQIVDRLNQWVRSQQPSPDWAADPMLAALPEPLADLPQVKGIGQMEFTRFDGYALREATWLRDISRWARGDRLNDLERAISLFDWTVRNIQVEPDLPERVPLFPWETLLFGRGTASERAWVFLLLLRQQDIDAAILSVEKRPPSEASMSEDSLEPWCVGALIEGKVYLFDALLGLPVAAADGVAKNKNGQLTIRPATLAEVRSNGKLLERMNVNENRPYRVQPSDLDRVTVLLEASPQYLARPMKTLESHLAGERKIVLTASPSAAAERWKKAGPDGVRLWLHPYQTIRRRSSLDRRQIQSRLLAIVPFYAIPNAPLWRARLLYMKGEFVGEEGAMRYYQAARPSDAELRASSIDVGQKSLLFSGKQDASYWCGLIAFQRGDYDAAVDYFLNRTLKAFPNGVWTSGARYNLARSYEATGETERAILTYGLDATSPGYHGDLLRAKWLREIGR